MISQHTLNRKLGALLLGIVFSTASASAKPLKVFILAGQSNMQGSAHIQTFSALGDDAATAPLLEDILDANGDPVVAKNSWVTYRTNRQQKEVTLQGNVKVGYGFDDERIGPEYGFGIYMDQALDEPILIIKTAWGGKSLAVDFRPPSAGPYVPSEREKAAGKTFAKNQVGHYYREMMSFVKDTLKDSQSIKNAVPEYQADQGYELAGFVWFQGWNDMCNSHHIEQYTTNMIHFIKDVRTELKSPKLPFVVGILGVYGTDPDSRKFDKGLPVSVFRKTQFSAVELYDERTEKPFRGNVIAVDSGPFYDLSLSDIYWKRRLTANFKQRIQKGEMTTEEYKNECAKYGFGDGELTEEERNAWERKASNAEYHYLGSASTFIQTGKAFAEALLKLNEK